MPAHGSLFGTQDVFHYTKSANGQQNLFTKAGSPAYRGDFLWVIDSGVILGNGTTTGTTLLAPNSFVAGSTFKLIILGWLVSCGGKGGNGGGLNGGGQYGLKAGNVFDIRVPAITIDVTNGFLSCGGGGGHGGAGATASFPPYPSTNGGGGGGGQGTAGGGGGDPGGTFGSFSAPGVGGEPGGQVPGDFGYGGCEWGVQLVGTSGSAFTVSAHGNTIIWIGKTIDNVKGPII